MARFDNGYSVSVISDGYGGSEGYKELAVVHHGQLCYQTPITSDVLGWLTDEKVDEYTRQVAALPRNDECDHHHQWDWED